MIIGYITLIASCKSTNNNNDAASQPLANHAISSNVDSNATAAAIKVFLKYLFGY
jgi:hypothetical protein